MDEYRLSQRIGPGFWECHRAIRNGGVWELVEKGGRGSGKSSFLSLELIYQLLLHPDCHAAVLRRVGNTLRSSVYAQVLWAIGELGLTGLFECTLSPLECTYLPTGQKILFFGMDDPGKLKSLKTPFGYVGLAWFEELDQFDREQVRSAEQSLFRGGDFSLCFKSFNPPASPKAWVNRYALEVQPGKRVHHSTFLEVPPDWLGPRFLTAAEHLRLTNETAYRNEYLGEAVGFGAAVFPNLELRPISDGEIAGFDNTLSGVDWGWYPDPWAFNRMHYDARRRRVYLFDELTRLRTGNRDTAQLLLKRLPGGERITADSAEPKSVADYCGAGLKCRGAEKGPGSVSYSMKWLQALDAIVIDPQRCPDTAREFSEYAYDKDEGFPDRDNHHIDAVRYGLSPIWKRRGQ